MREAAFQRQNADRWKHFEELLKERHGVDPDRLADLYVHITDDLAYARTFYPESRTTTYLNALAAEIHRTIYRNKRERTSRIATFWKYELPELFHEHRRELMYSALFFVLAMIIGIVSAGYDEGFVRLIMGDTYVNMTLENIRKGDPMAVYKGDGQFDMFFLLTFHNINVAMRAFVYGVMFSVGTIASIMANGIMLGAFQTFCYQHGVLARSMMSIWIHGVIEISAIVIAGCAGLTMGNSILFPGTYTRMQSFRRGARHGIKIMFGLVPFFIVAGFLESFVTRYTSMPAVLSIGIILSSLAAIVWYVVVYPTRLAKRHDSLIATATASMLPAPSSANSKPQ